MDNKVEHLETFLFEATTPITVAAKNKEYAKKLALEHLISVYGNRQWEVKVKEEL